MKLYVNGNGYGFEIRLSVTWRSLDAFLKALLLIIGTLNALLAAPEVIRLLTLLGL